ncbi:MAG: glycosyltransferase family 4 protein [Acidimicrobiaceae bacterium]|nr:glycosyltransferase family 4 protein [Acidimicrobiaceae bacterium]
MTRGHGLVIDVSSVPPKPAGAGRYAIELVSNLGQSAFRFDLVAKVRDVRFWEELSSEKVLLAAPDLRPARILWEQVMLARKLNLLDAGIYHGIHYTIPRDYKGPRISTIHDMTMIEHPEWHERVKVKYFSNAIRYAVDNADAIIVPSNFTKDRLEAYFGRLDKVHVIYHGVDHQRFRPIGDMAEDKWVGESSESIKVVLHIGTIEPRKNLENLVKAFEIVAENYPEIRLWLVGQEGWKSESVFKSIVSSKYSERIRLVGYLPEPELLNLLSHAACVAYPSLAEGFGFPVLEAMASGVPIVTSSGSVMEEVTNGSAWLCDPLDPHSISEKIVKAISGSEDSKSKVAKGIARSEKFNWAESTRRHLEIYSAFGFGLES